MRSSSTTRIPSARKREQYLRSYRDAEQAAEDDAKGAKQLFEVLTQHPVHKFLFEIETRERLIETLRGLIIDNPTFRIHALDEHLRSISSEDVFNSFSMFDDIPVTGGRAIAPAHAANVLTSVPRTCTFAKGLHDAILELKERFPDTKPLRILYAGSGPFATLALPSMASFEPGEVEFDLLELQTISLDNARRVMEVCGFEDFCGEFIKEDATQFRPGKKYHAVITETMGPGLGEEPQVEIMANLEDALVDGGLMLPEEIALGIMLHREDGDEKLFRELWTWLPRNGETRDEILMSCPLAYPEARPIVVASFAEIKVFGANRLALGDCMLTNPFAVGVITSGQTGETVHVTYKPGANIIYGPTPGMCEVR